MKQYALKFDGSVAFGSAEHFYHYLWGYLLPSVFQISKIESCNKKDKKQFCFHSCGPIMDQITGEVANLLDINYRICDSAFHQTGKNVEEVDVARWDIGLAFSNIRSLIGFYNDHDENVQWTLRLKHFISQKRLSDSLNNIRKLMLDIVSSVTPSSEIVDYSDAYLILERSSEPAYYQRGGKAEIPTYGTGRRSLSHINEARDYLLGRHIPVKVFEPGAYSLADQIRVFHNCKGIIGIMGAEFANLIWMKPGAKAIRIIPSSIGGMPPVSLNLSRLLKLDLIDIESCEGNTVKLRPESFEVYLK